MSQAKDRNCCLVVLVNTWAQCVERQFWGIFLFLCTTSDFTIYFMDVLWSCRLDIWKYVSISMLLPKDFQPIVRGNYRSLSRICSCLIRIEASRTLKNAPKPQLMGLKPLRSRTWISKHQQFHEFFPWWTYWVFQIPTISFICLWA